MASILTLRIAAAAVWLFNGLWLKLIAQDARHLNIVSSLAVTVGLRPEMALGIIGSLETVLGILILTGKWNRPVQVIQIFALLGMNIAGIVFGGGTIENPVGLLISNLPLIACALVLYFEDRESFRRT